MITTPNRLAEMRQAMERGEKVEPNRIAQLQALDLAVAGRQFAEEAIQSHEAEDGKFIAEFFPK